MPRSGTAPDRRPAVALHARAACDACGIVLEATVHQGRVVDVVRGYSLENGLPIVAKITRAEWLGHRGAVQLIEREFRILSSIRHPRVVRPLAFAERSGAAVLVLEELPGGDLVPLAGASPQLWAGPALDVLAALTAVSRSGFVHADLKARNVLMDRHGRATLIDFGSAVPVGRPLPAGGRTRAHEPLRFVLERAEPVLDIYAFAVLVHELWTCELPFGPAPLRFSPPARPAAPTPALGALADRLSTTLSAADPDGIGTLIEFADVLESVHVEAAGASVP